MLLMKKPMIISSLSLIVPYLLVLIFLLIDYQDESRTFAYLAAASSILLVIGPTISMLQGIRLFRGTTQTRLRVYSGLVCGMSFIFLLFGSWCIYAIVKAIALVNASGALE